MMLGESYEPISAGQAELLRRDALRFSLQAITQDMETVLEAKRKLDSNMNQQLLMEELVLKLKGGHLFA
ncbi:DNA polymerase III subunit delta' [Listeria aquatica FSL S10-1188]|uniref:DNA polymerase III subunit delta n=1 Tax=Listeria aquatica FSL S10-1188 TaxID=1265818 RepID=W7B3Q6_9LIST|nr:DNA polymerase III subunit delta' [Listeria aquatica FSL S10-1188]